MIYSDPFFRKGAFAGFLLVPAFYAASVTEGGVLVRTPHAFTQMAIGAHSVAVSVLLMLGFVEVADSINKVCTSFRNNWTHLIGLGFLLGGTIVHVLNLVYLHQKGAPLDRSDPALCRYLHFCKIFVFATILLEYKLYNLALAASERIGSRNTHLLIK